MLRRLGFVATRYSNVRTHTTLGGISDSLLLTLSLNHNTSGTNQRELVGNLKKNNIITSEAVYQAMLATDRGDFVDENTTDNAWRDAPVSIGSGATISSPHMHALALEALAPSLQPGGRALDVGCGSGYLTVCMANMMAATSDAKSGKQSYVLGIDHVEALAIKSLQNAGKHHAHLLKSRLLRFQCASPLPLAATATVAQGLEKGEVEGGFDAIHCGAAVMTVPPVLLQWLAPGGQLLIPVSKHGAAFARVASAFSDSALMAAASGRTELGEQELLLIAKNKDGSLSSRSLMTVIYSPLTACPPRPPPPPESEHELQTQIDHVQSKLREWQNTYKLTHVNQKPTSAVMAQDPLASSLLTEYSQLAAKLKLCKRRPSPNN